MIWNVADMLRGPFKPHELSLIHIFYPIVLILLNSLKKEGTFTTSTVFQLPTKETFAGLSNYCLLYTSRRAQALRLGPCR